MRVAVVACGALALHVRAIAARRGWDVDIHPLPPELRHMVVLGDLGSAVRGRLADFLRLLVQMFVVLGRHAINLVSAFAVKSTMGTTRA